MTTPKLEILICTTARRLEKINPAGLPQVDGVVYSVHCQRGNGVQPNAPNWDRDDFKLYFHADNGLSRNRNHSLDCATTPYVMIADDDIAYNPVALSQIIAKFDQNPGLDYLTVRSSGSHPRPFPQDGHDLSIGVKGYSPVSFEIALRLKSINDSNLRFSELAGIGAPWLIAGEEDLFLFHARKSGLKGQFFAVDAVVHPDETTCERLVATKEFQRTKGAVMRIIRGPISALVRIPIEAYRAPKPWTKAFYWLCRGYVYAIKHRNSL